MSSGDGDTVAAAEAMEKAEAALGVAKEARHDAAEANKRMTAIEFVLDNVDLPLSKQREIVLRQILIDRAKANGGVFDGRAAMHYVDVQNALRDRCNDEIPPRAAYDLMEETEYGDGFTMTEKTKDGRTVRAIGVTLDKLPTHGDSTVASPSQPGGIADE